MCMYMCMYICIYMHVYERACACARICMYVHIYIMSLPTIQFQRFFFLWSFLLTMLFFLQYVQEVPLKLHFFFLHFNFDH